MQVMVGVEKRKVENLKKELTQSKAEKDKVLKELCRVKTHSLDQIEAKNKEISNLQEKLQYLYRQEQQKKQSDDTSIHKIELLEAEIKSLQKENFNLRSKAFKKSKSSTNSSNESSGRVTPNG